MITRDLASLSYVHALDSTGQAAFHSCTVSGFTSACGLFVGTTANALPWAVGGRIIDRLALGRHYTAAIPIVDAYGDIQASAGSTAMIQYLGVQAGVQHSSSTAGAWTDFSTADWPAEQAFHLVTTATSTADKYYTVKGAELSTPTAGQLSTALTTSTSTGYAVFVQTANAAINLTAAKRYIRMIVAPHIETTGCAGSVIRAISGGFLFGTPDGAPPTTPVGRVVVTSGCSTST